MLKWVTPSLAVTDGEWPREDTFTYDEAVAWITLGGTAYVESDDVARQVLSVLGLSEREIEDRLHFAATGKVLA